MKLIKGVHSRIWRSVGMPVSIGLAPNKTLSKIASKQIGKMKRLDKAIDRINKCYGSETIVIGAQEYTRPNGKGRAEVFARSTSGRLLPTGRKNAIKHDFKSKNPTTRWSDIIHLK